MMTRRMLVTAGIVCGAAVLAVLALWRYQQRTVDARQAECETRDMAMRGEPLPATSTPLHAGADTPCVSPFDAAKVDAGLINFTNLARVKAKLAAREYLSDDDLDVLLASEPASQLHLELHRAYSCNDWDTNYVIYLRFLEKTRDQFMAGKGGTNSYLAEVGEVYNLHKDRVPGMKEKLRALELELEAPPREIDTPDPVEYSIRTRQYHLLLGLIASAYDGDAAVERYLRAAHTPVGIRPEYLYEAAAAYLEQGRVEEAKAMLERIASLRDDEFERFSIDTDDLYATALRRNRALRERARRMLATGHYDMTR